MKQRPTVLNNLYITSVLVNLRFFSGIFFMLTLWVPHITLRHKSSTSILRPLFELHIAAGYKVFYSKCIKILKYFYIRSWCCKNFHTLPLNSLLLQTRSNCLQNSLGLWDQKTIPTTSLYKKYITIFFIDRLKTQVSFQIQQSRVSAVRDQLRVFAGEVLVVEHFAFSTGDEARLALHTGDQVVTVTRNREPGERPELGRLCVRWNFSRAFEANHR